MEQNVRIADSIERLEEKYKAIEEMLSYQVSGSLRTSY